MHSHVLEIPQRHITIQDMINESKTLIQGMQELQLRYHIKSTKTAVRRSEALWESVANARKDKK